MKQGNKSLLDLQDQIRMFCNERDWDQFHNPKDLAISLSLEAAEVLEHFQWKNPEEMAHHIISKGAEIGEELADVLYWVLLLTNKLNIDLLEAFQAKMQKNAAKYPVEKAKSNHMKYVDF